MNFLCKNGFLGLIFLLISSSIIAQNIGIVTSTPLQTMYVNGSLREANGVIQNGNSPITTTADLGLYSLKATSCLRLETNNSLIKFFTENGSLGIGSDIPAGKLQTKSSLNHPLGQTNTDSLKREMAKQKKAAAAQFAKTQLNVMVTKADDNSFGYYILADGNILIDQKNIPGVPGNRGFVSEAEAKRTAEFAIKKLKQGEMPPSLTEEDLKKLKITLPRIKN